MQATIRGPGLSFTLDVDGCDHDADWLRGTVELQVGSFRGRKQVSALTPQLAAFRDQLQVLAHERSGRATLSHIEEEFELTVALRDGRGTVAGFVRDFDGPSLSFRAIEIDQAFVAAALAQFDAVVAAVSSAP
jgi:hypothetical protein